ncbi:Sua5 family C-terminal domain-containing protein [Streptomyces sp. NPDC005708]|uniref:Sua5 family C-terminal domain-containing protein n=1 Tax=Streptomyces sp. NPDC005708 TaxID=3154564 RepID=UPI0033ED648E
MLERPLAVPATNRIRVPGQHPSQYAPRAGRPRRAGEGRLRSEACAGAGAPGGRVFPVLRRRCAQGARRGGSPRIDGRLRARLYGFLRELDQQGCDLIVASLPVEEGLGLAIANRLRRGVPAQRVTSTDAVPSRSCFPTAAAYGRKVQEISAWEVA